MHKWIQGLPVRAGNCSYSLTNSLPPLVQQSKEFRQHIRCNTIGGSTDLVPTRVLCVGRIARSPSTKRLRRRSAKGSGGCVRGSTGRRWSTAVGTCGAPATSSGPTGTWIHGAGGGGAHHLDLMWSNPLDPASFRLRGRRSYSRGGEGVGVMSRAQMTLHGSPAGQVKEARAAEMKNVRRWINEANQMRRTESASARQRHIAIS
eukprot:1194611-Prorocentrum_minimum.AAC.4